MIRYGGLKRIWKGATMSLAASTDICFALLYYTKQTRSILYTWSRPLSSFTKPADQLVVTVGWFQFVEHTWDSWRAQYCHIVNTLTVDVGTLNNNSNLKLYTLRFHVHSLASFAVVVVNNFYWFWELDLLMIYKYKTSEQASKPNPWSEEEEEEEY